MSSFNKHLMISNNPSNFNQGVSRSKQPVAPYHRNYKLTQFDNFLREIKATTENKCGTSGGFSNCAVRVITLLVQSNEIVPSNTCCCLLLEECLDFNQKNII